MMYCSVCLKHRGHKIWYIKLLSYGEALVYQTELIGKLGQSTIESYQREWVRVTAKENGTRSSFLSHLDTINKAQKTDAAAPSCRIDSAGSSAVIFALKLIKVKHPSSSYKYYTLKTYYIKLRRQLKIFKVPNSDFSDFSRTTVKHC